jgi:hypothetical protein
MLKFSTFFDPFDLMAVKTKEPERCPGGDSTIRIISTSRGLVLATKTPDTGPLEHPAEAMAEMIATMVKMRKYCSNEPNFRPSVILDFPLKRFHIDSPYLSYSNVS